MSALIGFRIELRDPQGKVMGALYCEDKFEAVAVPQRGDLIGLTAIAGPPTPDSSLPELQSLHALADVFPFMTVHHLEHYPTADHEVGERPGCMVVLQGRAPSTDQGASALVQLFGLKGWTISPGETDLEPLDPFNAAALRWLAEQNKPPAD